MILNLQPATAAFSHDGLTFDGGLPGAVLLLGPEEREVSWTAPARTAITPTRRQTPLGEGLEHLSAWSFMDGFRLEWRVTRLVRWPGFTLRAVFSNDTATPVRLRRLGILHAPAPALQPDSDGWFAHSAIGGWLDPPSGPLAPDQAGLREFQDFASLYSHQGERGVFIAAVGPAESDVLIRLMSGQGGHGLAISSEMSDIVVDPGESRTSEEVLFLIAPHREASEAAMRWIAATHGTRVHRGPFTGWCSWYEQYGAVTAAHVQTVAEAARAHRERIPQAVIQIDEGYEQAWGDWRPNAKFPEGWAPVVAAIRAAGAIPGVWIAPLGVYDSTGLIQEHPEWFQVQAGALEPVSASWRGNPMHYLDPTHPGTRGFIRSIIRNALAEGFRYFKIDFNAVYHARFHDAKATRFQALRQLYRLYREEMGGDAYLNSCMARLERAVVGFADALRIGADSDYQWPWIWKAIRGTAETAPANGILMAVDPDVFFTRSRPTAPSPVTPEQLQSWQGFVGLLGGVSMTSEPLFKPEYVASLRELEVLTPPVPERGRSFLPGMEVIPSLFGFVAERPWGRFAAVQVLNASDLPGDTALQAPELDALGNCHLWSYRDGRYLGLASRTHVERQLPAWGSRLLRMTPVEKDGRPVLVGSDLHIGLGAAEIADWRASADTVAIALTDAGARDGAMWIHSTMPVLIEAVRGCAAEVESAGESLWRVKVSGRQRGARQTLRLAVNRPARTMESGADIGNEAEPAIRLALETTRPPVCAGPDTPAEPGSLRLAVRHVGKAAASGEIELRSGNGDVVTLSPVSVPYALSPGETLTSDIALIPGRYAPRLTIAARTKHAPAWQAWTTVTMERSPIVIPSADDTWAGLAAATGRMASMALPGEPPIARLRLAASGTQVFCEIRVNDEAPAPGVGALWEGSCVEMFFAMQEGKDVRQFFFQPETGLRGVRVFQAAGIGRQNACPSIRAEMEPVPGGYAMRMLIPKSTAGIADPAREFRLDLQVSRRVGGKVENTPLLGGEGAYGSSALYARVRIADNRPSHGGPAA